MGSSYQEPIVKAWKTVWRIEFDLLGGELPNWSPSLPESDMMFS